MVALTPSLGKQWFRDGGSDFKFRQFHRKASVFTTLSPVEDFPGGGSSDYTFGSDQLFGVVALTPTLVQARLNTGVKW